MKEKETKKEGIGETKASEKAEAKAAKPLSKRKKFMPTSDGFMPKRKK